MDNQTVALTNDTSSPLAGESSTASRAGPKPPPSSKTLHGLDWLNFFLADVQTGVGPFLAIYLAAYQWDEQRVGLALTVGGIAGIITQTPAGQLIDQIRWKRALIAAAIVAGWRLEVCSSPFSPHSGR